MIHVNKLFLGRIYFFFQILNVNKRNIGINWRYSGILGATWSFGRFFVLMQFPSLQSCKWWQQRVIEQYLTYINSLRHQLSNAYLVLSQTVSDKVSGWKIVTLPRENLRKIENIACQFYLNVLYDNNNFSFVIFWCKLSKRIFMCHMTCLKPFS